jgi:hypothetical protein
MRTLQALFWVVAVSFLLAGGNAIGSNYGDAPGAEYLGEESPAYASSKRVVASITKLKGLCNRHETACGYAGTVGTFSLEAVDAAMALVYRAGDATVTPVSPEPGEAMLDDDLIFLDDEELGEVG